MSAIAPLMHLESSNSQPEAARHMVVMLHGWGATYQDLFPLAQMLELPPCRFFFPNAPFPHFQNPAGRAWYALEHQDFRGLAESREQLTNWLKYLFEQTAIPPARTAMMGFSQGGAMTLDVGPKMNFAALCSCSGYLHYQPLPGKLNPAPTLLLHGTRDPVVPFQAARQAQQSLTAVGVPVEQADFSGGHEIPAIALHHMQAFFQKHLFKIVP